jgi:hypothetical protein
MNVFGSGKEKAVPVQVVQQFLGQERIPDGFVKPEDSIGLIKLAYWSSKIQSKTGDLFKNGA